MQNDSTVETEQAEIPVHLQCEPRTFKVTYDKFSDVCELEFTIIIKCTDEMLHEHNNFWAGYNDRLNENNGDIVAVMLKMIARDVFYACYEDKANVGIPPYKWGINTIFQEEGWDCNSFEITKLHFESYVNGDDFEITPISVEG
ncbi:MULTISPECIES: DUF2528 family protein [unclassified Acinetobacter]|uniref:DUF2528 family protein n=1 Tax=unclassified Acinetobacter TaxID=196816 RepID=UPI0022AC1500|nr:MULTISPECIES: DUF2528 family protein [unclassified Acinetobacter]WAU72980.1 DUF2528 family protein [Acinetobacter sp. TR11]WAU76073.1 DUF2528 family protein [Acinetobacter sp. TR3]